MIFIAVVSENGGAVTKYAEFETLAEAEAHVARYGGFAAPDPGGSFASWRANPGAKTLTLGPPVNPVTDNRPQLPDAAGNSLPALRAEVQGIIDALKTAGILQP